MYNPIIFLYDYPVDFLKQIPQYDGYYISQTGNVYSEKRGNLTKLKQELKQGYYYVNLYNENGTKHHRVSRLVATGFVDNPDNHNIVNHINGDKLYNYDYNLEWCNISHNTKHAFAMGLAKNDSGYDDSQSHPVVCTVISTGEKINFGSCRLAAKHTGVNISTVCRQCKGGNYDKRSKYIFEYQ